MKDLETEVETGKTKLYLLLSFQSIHFLTRNILKEARDLVNLRLEKARSRTETNIAPDRMVASLPKKPPNGKTTSLNAQAKSEVNVSSTREGEPLVKQRSGVDQKQDESSDPLKDWEKSWRVSDTIH